METVISNEHSFFTAASLHENLIENLFTYCEVLQDLLWGTYGNLLPCQNTDDRDFSQHLKINCQKILSIIFTWSSVAVPSSREDKTVDRQALQSVKHAKIWT